MKIAEDLYIAHPNGVDCEPLFELNLERLSDDMALVRLNIGHMSFGIGQPRNGIEAASVMRTFRDALDTLLNHAYAEGRKDERESWVPEWQSVRGCGWHHYTPDNIAAIIRDLKAVEEGSETPEWINRDHRTRCGILWRVISALAHDVPTNADWRPIETAPIDEQILIAATPDWVSEGIVFVDTDSDDQGREVRTYNWADGSTLHENLKPIAWMPLPKHPDA